MRCTGGRLYVGISRDPLNRFKDHIAGRCTHTRMMRPEALIAGYPAGTHADAVKEERRVKRLPVREKRTIALLAAKSAPWRDLVAGRELPMPK